MGFPVMQLPVVQHWECHASGSCCKEHRIPLTDAERARIAAQGWDAEGDLSGYPPFHRGGWLRRRYFLNHRPDGSCVFLSAEGRCRIHERHGYETKPLACRLFPFVLVPAGDHWRVSLRFSCPSAAASTGPALSAYDAELADFAVRLAEREKLGPQPAGFLNRPPRLRGGVRLPWPDLLHLVDGLMMVLRDRRDPLERRWRKCLLLVDQLRKATPEQLQGSALAETLDILRAGAAADTPADPHQVAAPTALGRVLFRLAAAVYTRKDHGRDRGLGASGRLALLRGALVFLRGAGLVPRLHRLIPVATFEQAEEPRGPLSGAAQEVLERYYAIKVGSLQFCGAGSFGLSIWEGLENLAVTVPVILWLVRLFRDVPPVEAAVKALTVVDYHLGFNPLLASLRLRLGFRSLARRGELARLIAWYSR
jgi:lysine-N-methylase